MNPPYRQLAIFLKRENSAQNSQKTVQDEIIKTFLLFINFHPNECSWNTGTTSYFLTTHTHSLTDLSYVGLVAHYLFCIMENVPVTYIG